MAFKPLIHGLHLFLSLFLFASRTSASPGKNGGFSTRLIHGDSPLSPFYNPSTTAFGRLTAAAHRSVARSNSRHLSQRQSPSPNSITSRSHPNTADFLMELSIGTPPVKVLAVMDTGSDLFWSRCKPCVDCVGRQVPFIDPTLSSTYQDLPCDAPLCKELDPLACNKGPKCQYIYGYGLGDFTSGAMATETLTFDSTEGGAVSIAGIGFGCGHNNSASFDGHMVGMAGIGAGPVSLISQLGPSIGGKFSYCLAPFQENTSTSVMNFGEQAVLPGGNVVSTPLVPKDDKTYYFVTLERISVGGTSIDVLTPGASGAGNIFIDCGTTVTLLDNNVFNRLADAVSAAVKLGRTTDPGKTFACYSATSRDGFPAITFHFAGGADLELQPLNTFSVPSPDGLVCLVMQPTNGTAVFGNLAQQNFHIGYDLVGKKVSFAPAQCSSI